MMAETNRLGAIMESGDAGLGQQVYHHLLESIDLYFAPTESAEPVTASREGAKNEGSCHHCRIYGNFL